MNHFFKTLACATLFLALGAATVQAEVSLAYVDATRLLKDAPQVQQIKQKIRKEFEARALRLEQTRKQITLLEARLTTDAGHLSEEEKRRLKSDINNRRLKLKNTRDELEQDKQLRFREEEEHFSRIIGEVIQQMAQDERLDLVLRDGVMWVSPRIDMTERVLERLRSMLAKDN